RQSGLQTAAQLALGLQLQHQRQLIEGCRGHCLSLQRRSNTELQLINTETPVGIYLVEMLRIQPREPMAQVSLPLLIRSRQASIQIHLPLAQTHRLSRVFCLYWSQNQ